MALNEKCRDGTGKPVLTANINHDRPRAAPATWPYPGHRTMAEVMCHEALGRAPALSRVERAARHKRIVAAYQTGLSSRAVAEMFGVSDTLVRQVVGLYECARPPGRPRKSA